MSDVTTENETVKEDNKVEDRLVALKKKANLMGIKFNPKIGADKLEEKIRLHMEDIDIPPATTKSTKSVGPSSKIKELEKKAKAPILCQIFDLDASQQSDPTILMKLQNAYFSVGCIIQKEKEQLVPSCIVDALLNKTMIKWIPAINTITKRPTGNKTPVHTKRYNIQILDRNPKI